MLDKKKIAVYKRAKTAEKRWAEKKYKAFCQMFDVGRAVKFQRQTNGRVHIGRVLEIHPYRCYLRVRNIKTQTIYWIDESWLVFNN